MCIYIYRQHNEALNIDIYIYPDTFLSIYVYICMFVYTHKNMHAHECRDM